MRSRRGPLNLFLSYASEDADIVSAFDKAFTTLKMHSEGNIEIFWDKNALSAGSPSRLLDTLTLNLSDCDYLVIIYTGASRTSISYPSTEYGFFLAQIQGDVEKFGASERKIVRVYFDGQPPVQTGQLDVEINITAPEFQQSADDYLKTVKDSLGKNRYAVLINTLEDIGAMADRRMPAGKRQEDVPSGEWARRIAARTKAISEDIVPELMVSLHDALRVRIKTRTTEQALIEFKLPASISKNIENIGEIPPDTKLIEHANAFAIFGISSDDHATTWNTFESEILRTPGGNFTISSIKRTAISAISPNIVRDDEQLIRSPVTQQAYRIIISSQWEYYDASRVINMTLVPTLWLGFGINSEAAITIGFIAVAAKARELFFKSKSPLSIDAFIRYGFADTQKNAKRILDALDIMRNQMHAVGLDQQESVVVYFGDDREAAKRAGELSVQVAPVEQKFKTAALHFLQLDELKLDAETKNKEKASYLEILSSFYDLISAVNGETMKRAVGRLNDYILADSPRTA